MIWPLQGDPRREVGFQYKWLFTGCRMHEEHLVEYLQGASALTEIGSAARNGFWSERSWHIRIWSHCFRLSSEIKHWDQRLGFEANNITIKISPMTFLSSKPSSKTILYMSPSTSDMISATIFGQKVGQPQTMFTKTSCSLPSATGSDAGLHLQYFAPQRVL